MRELLGDPEAYPDACATPLAVPARNAPTAIFVRPLVHKALPPRARAAHARADT